MGKILFYLFFDNHINLLNMGKKIIYYYFFKVTWIKKTIKFLPMFSKFIRERPTYW